MLIYLSFDEKDNASGTRLKTILTPLEHQYGIRVWSKQDIRAGDVWQQEMASHLSLSSLFVAIVSSDYLASDRCQSELSAAAELQRRCQLDIAIVLSRACEWRYLPFAVKCVLPSNGKSISSWSRNDQAWLNVHKGIADLILAAYKRLDGKQ